jgi:hypothetical protein
MYLQMYIITPHTQQALVFNKSPSSAKSLRHQPRKTNNYKPIIVHLKFNENPPKKPKKRVETLANTLECLYSRNCNVLGSVTRTNSTRIRESEMKAQGQRDNREKC